MGEYRGGNENDPRAPRELFHSLRSLYPIYTYIRRARRRSTYRALIETYSWQAEASRAPFRLTLHAGP